MEYEYGPPSISLFPETPNCCGHKSILRTPAPQLLLRRQSLQEQRLFFFICLFYHLLFNRIVLHIFFSRFFLLQHHHLLLITFIFIFFIMVWVCPSSCPSWRPSACWRGGCGRPLLIVPRRSTCWYDVGVPLLVLQETRPSACWCAGCGCICGPRVAPAHMNKGCV
jgi:hypothetical protein